MHRIAVIDVGTNSVLYLMVEVTEDGKMLPLYQEALSIRLGKKLFPKNTIRGDSVSELIKVLKEYKKLSEKEKVTRLIAVGTHVFRSAKNRSEVLEKIKVETDIQIEVLTEEEEAEWSYRGALYGKDLTGKILMADIGGGSTELVLGKNSVIMDFRSLKMGAVGLTEKFIHHDPPLENECTFIMENVSYHLKDSVELLLKQGEQFIGVGGTVTTLAALVLHLEKYQPMAVQGFIMTFTDVKKMLEKLKHLPLAKRKELLKLDPKRADIIVAGTIILERIMTLGNFKKIIVSDQGLRFGIALREWFAYSENYSLPKLSRMQSKDNNKK